MNTRLGLRSSATGTKLCVYCGKLADTKDHAPPQCLMLSPLPSNLITLPACNACNNGFSFDEGIVRAFLSLVGVHPRLIEERLPGGRFDKTLEHHPKIRAILELSLQSDGNYMLTGQLLESFKKVFFKTAQGLFFGFYDRLVPTSELFLLRVEDQRQIKPDEIIIQLRPNPLIEIGNKPISEISPHSWHTREPIYIFELGDPVTGKKSRRVFRLVRDTPVEWFHFQPGTFGVAFVKCYDGGCACVMDLWQTLTVTVRAPWPGDRGPLRRGRKNPWSRDRKST